ncbi:hypothetical protein [Plantactinospora sp. CA-290183]|uniref:hypothetical protein n=1 Tax=Plantactinospora sp. CA-290183 TaxID=3240006 RepID=UPI003D94A401
MLSPHIRLALREVVAGIEDKAQTHGWDAPPVLLALFHRQLAEDLPVHLIDVAAMPFTLNLDPAPSSGIAGVLNLLVDFVTMPEAASPIKDWLHSGERTFVGIGLVFEGFQYIPYPGYVHGDINREPAKATAEVRLVCAVDTDGRYYQVDRIRGEDRRRATIHDRVAPELGAVPHALSRLVTAVRNL